MKRFMLLFVSLLALLFLNSFVFAQQDTTLTVTSTGNVGIGTTNPASRLTVISANSNDGEAILGESTALTGQRFGVRGATRSTHPFASGVHGRAGSTSGNANGVWGRSLSTTGRGVFGEAFSSTGINYGVRGETNSSSGYGGYFIGRGYFSGNVGIGTTSPQAKLDINGDLRVTNSGNSSVLLNLNSDRSWEFHSQERAVAPP